jgi:hypothetical protein
MKFAGHVFIRRAVIVAVAGFALAFAQAASAQNNPLAGTWKLDPAKSTGPVKYQSMTLSFGDGTQMTLDGVDAQGKPVKGSFDAVPDGKQHPITGMGPYDSGSWTKANENTVSYQYFKGKGIVVLGTRTLSADGSTVTFRDNIYDNNGKQTGTSILVFQNPDVKVASANKPAAQTQAPAAPKSVFTPQETEAVAALDKNDNDAAIKLFTAIIDSKQQTPMLYYDYGSRGIAYLRKDQKDQALADFDAAIKLKPDDGDSHFRRGAIKLERMDYQAAIDDLSVAIDKDSMNADAYNMRSFAYYRIQQTSKGAEDTEKACALKKDYCVN